MMKKDKTLLNGRYWCDYLPKSVLLTNGDYHVLNVNEMTRQEYIYTIVKTEIYIKWAQSTFIKLYPDATPDMAILHLGLHVIETKEDYKSGANIDDGPMEFNHLRFKEYRNHCNMHDITKTLITMYQHIESLRFFISGTAGNMYGAHCYPPKGILAAVNDSKLRKIFRLVHLGAGYDDEKDLEPESHDDREAMELCNIDSRWDIMMTSRPQGTECMNGMKLDTNDLDQFQSLGMAFSAMKKIEFEAFFDNPSPSVPWGLGMNYYNAFGKGEIEAIRDLLESFDCSFVCKSYLPSGARDPVQLSPPYLKVSVKEKIPKRSLSINNGNFILRPVYYKNVFVAPTKNVYKGFTNGLGSYGRKATLTMGSDIAVQYKEFETGKLMVFFGKVLLPMKVYLELNTHIQCGSNRASGRRLFEPIMILRVLWYEKLPRGRAIQGHDIYRLNTNERNLDNKERFTVVHKVVPAVDMKHVRMVKKKNISNACLSKKHHEDEQAGDLF